MDADSSLDPADLPLVADPVQNGSADLVLGRRSPPARGAWPLHARVGNQALGAMIRRRAGVQVRDLGPMRAARRDGLLALGLADRRFGYPLEMVLRAVEAGWHIEELDVPYLTRTGKSKVTGTFRGTLRTSRDMRRVLARDGLRPPAPAGAPAIARAQMVVIAKDPVPGRAKTRLTPPFSPLQAARLAAAALADTLAAAALVPPPGVCSRSRGRQAAGSPRDSTWSPSEAAALMSASPPPFGRGVRRAASPCGPYRHGHAPGDTRDARNGDPPADAPVPRTPYSAQLLMVASGCSGCGAPTRNCCWSAYVDGRYRPRSAGPAGPRPACGCAGCPDAVPMWTTRRRRVPWPPRYRAAASPRP